jgi:hypothetical protein
MRSVGMTCTQNVNDVTMRSTERHFLKSIILRECRSRQTIQILLNNSIGRLLEHVDFLLRSKTVEGKCENNKLLKK